MSSWQLIHQPCPQLCGLLICQVCLRTMTSHFSHINVKKARADLLSTNMFVFGFFFYLREIAFGSPVDFPFLEHRCGRMMHSLWAADCYSCRYTVPLRKGEPTDDIMWLHGRLSGWVRWMWADWKSQCSLCLGTKSSCGEDISYSVSIKTWVTRRKIKCTFNSSSTDNPTRVASTHL